MSVELLYTSAAQGLKQGSRGFCTVLSTAGMPINLATRLEGLSAYRHQFPPNHPDADKNPVSFSHLRFSIGGRKVSILSRISDYGIDYSQRTNKLAHHVVLDAPELTPAGPAWLMEHGSIFRDAWNGQCETPANGPAIAMQNQSPRICMEWGHRCGDAGWGGVVADAFLESAGKPLWIVFSLSQSQYLLRLLSESIALLPVDQRWRATFSTYATNLPPDADCKVRCVLQGTDEARLAPARGAVIDLTKPLPAPPATANVTAAREGPDIPQLPAEETPTPQIGKTKSAASQPRSQIKHSMVVDDALNQAHDAPPLASLPSLPPAIKPKQFKPKSEASSDYSTANARWLKWTLVAASVAAVLTLITTISLLVRNTKGSPELAGGSAQVAGSNAESSTSSTDPNESNGHDVTTKQYQDGNNARAEGVHDSSEGTAEGGGSGLNTAIVGAQGQTGAVLPIDGTDNRQTGSSMNTPEQTNGVKHDNSDQANAQSPRNGSSSGIDSDALVPENVPAGEQVADASRTGGSNLNALEKAVDAAKSGQTGNSVTEATDGPKTVSPIDGSATNVQNEQPLQGKLMASAVFLSGRIGVELVVPLKESLVGGTYHLTSDGGPRPGKAGTINIAGTNNKKLQMVKIGDDATLTVYLWLTDQGIGKAAKSVQSSTTAFFEVVKEWNVLVKRTGDQWSIDYTIERTNYTVSECMPGMEKLRTYLDDLERKLATKKTTALEGVLEAHQDMILRQKQIPDLEKQLQELKVAELNLTNSLRSLDSTAIFSTDPILYVGPTIDGQVNLTPIEAKFTIEPIFPDAKSDEPKKPSVKPVPANTK